MTKQELDNKLTENGLEPKQTYAVENPSWGDVYLIKKLNSSEGYYHGKSRVKILGLFFFLLFICNEFSPQRAFEEYCVSFPKGT